MPADTPAILNGRDARGRFTSPPTDPAMSWDLQRSLIDADAEQLTTYLHHRIAQAHVLIAAVASGSFGLHPDAAILADQDGAS